MDSSWTEDGLLDIWTEKEGGGQVHREGGWRCSRLYKKSFKSNIAAGGVSGGGVAGGGVAGVAGVAGGGYLSKQRAEHLLVAAHVDASIQSLQLLLVLPQRVLKRITLDVQVLVLRLSGDRRR